MVQSSKLQPQLPTSTVPKVISFSTALGADSSRQLSADSSFVATVQHQHLINCVRPSFNKVSGVPGVDLDEVFTTDLASTPVHVAKWGFLGESWPFFRPNFVNMEQYRTDMGVDEV